MPRRKPLLRRCETAGSDSFKHHSYHITVRGLNKLFRKNIKKADPPLAFCLQFFHSELAVFIDHFHFHELAEPQDLIKVKLNMIDEIDLSLFVYNLQYAKLQGQDLFQGGIRLMFIKDYRRFLGTSQIIPMVLNQGMLDIPFSEFKTAMRNVEISVYLVIKTFEHRGQGLQTGFDFPEIVDHRFEFNIGDVHSSMRKPE